MGRNIRIPRKTKTWFGIGGSTHSFTVNDTDFGAGMSVGETFTIMRVLGEYTIGPRAAPVALDVAQIDLGLAIVSSDAFALGETAAPDPVDEFGYPWLYWASHKMFFGTNSIGPASDQAMLRRSFDVRGMRKIRQDQTLAWIVQYSDINGAPPLSVEVAGSRVLLAD